MSRIPYYTLLINTHICSIKVKKCLGMVNANSRLLDFSGEGQNRIREGYIRSLIISVSYYFCENKDLK